MSIKNFCKYYKECLLFLDYSKEINRKIEFYTQNYLQIIASVSNSYKGYNLHKIVAFVTKATNLCSLCIHKG